VKSVIVEKELGLKCAAFANGECKQSSSTSAHHLPAN